MSLHLECIKFYKYAYYNNRNNGRNKRIKKRFHCFFCCEIHGYRELSLTCWQWKNLEPLNSIVKTAFKYPSHQSWLTHNWAAEKTVPSFKKAPTLFYNTVDFKFIPHAYATYVFGPEIHLNLHHPCTWFGIKSRLPDHLCAIGGRTKRAEKEEKLLQKRPKKKEPGPWIQLQFPVVIQLTTGLCSRSLTLTHVLHQLSR